MTTREAKMIRWRLAFYIAWAVIGGLLLSAASFYALGRIAPALAPFVIAFVFVFALQGPVSHLEARGIPRGWAAVFSMVVGFVVASVVMVFIAPPIGRQLVEFADAVPGFVTQGEELLSSAQSQLSSLVIPDWLRDAAVSVTQSLGAIAVSAGNAIARGLVSAGGGLATLVFDVFIGFVIAFWTTKDLPKIRQEVRTLAGERYEEDVENLLSTIGRMVGGYIRGQTIVSFVTGTIAGAGLALLGIPFALVLGLITFISNFVPYVGPLVAGTVAAAMGLFVSPLHAVGAIVVVLVAQNFTDIVVTPRVMSDQVDLHPTLVIFSLLVGGTLLGFWGMIFAIPVAATAKALFVYYYEQRTRRQLATEDGALFKMPTCDEETTEPCAEEGEPGEPERSPGAEPREGAST